MSQMINKNFSQTYHLRVKRYKAYLGLDVKLRHSMRDV